MLTNPTFFAPKFDFFTQFRLTIITMTEFEYLIKSYSTVTIDKQVKRSLSSNPNLTAKIVLDYPTIGWEAEEICYNPGLTMEDIDLLMQAGMTIYFSSLSSNPNLNMHAVEQLIFKQWDYWSMSGNLALTEAFVKNHIELDWNIDRLVANPSMGTNFLRHNFSSHKDTEAYQSLLDGTRETLETHPENFLYEEELSLDPERIEDNEHYYGVEAASVPHAFYLYKNGYRPKRDRNNRLYDILHGRESARLAEIRKKDEQYGRRMAHNVDLIQLTEDMRLDL